MNAENSIEGFPEIQAEGSNQNSEMDDTVLEVPMQNQPYSSPSPRVQEMRRSRSQIGNQIAPMDMVPYSNTSNSNGNSNTTVAEPVPIRKRQVSYKMDTSSRVCRNRLSAFLFLLHFVIAIGGIGYLGFLGIRKAFRGGKEKFHMEHWYPQLAAAAATGAVFSCVWQAIIRRFPSVMVKGILWSSPTVSLTAAIVLVSTSIPASVGVGVVLLVFSVAQALYACWVTPRLEYAATILSRALAPNPTSKLITDLYQPSFCIVITAFVWTSVWNLGIVGAISNTYGYAALIIFGLLVSFAWTMEVLRNVLNVTVSRVIALFYMRGMQSDTMFSFQRAFTTSLGSVSLGSIMVPVIESLRVVARVVNLVEGEDEFMFSFAHCCLRVMEFTFRFGNSWGFVQVATYGKGFVEASRDTWDLFRERDLEPVVDRDITSALCFLSGITGGSLCIIVSGSWTLATHKSLTATVSLISFFIGYFMCRITMAIPQACVCAYYVCYAENPDNRLFDDTISDHIKYFKDLPV
uniref:Choline transporter-like protein n=1 Tax=Picea sitchensis TaxID=3332 RepID=C0PQ49_PICSI|nr:unknown [Picea sitchensis]